MNLVDGNVVICGCAAPTDPIINCRENCIALDENMAWDVYTKLQYPRWGESAVSIKSSLYVCGGRYIAAER